MTNTTNTSAALYIEWSFDDSGCMIEARWYGSDRLVETGIALHEGRGQADTFRRALRDLHERIAL